MSRGSACAMILLASTACSSEPPPALLDEAREAVLDTLEDPVSARFDNAGAVVRQNEGLVCGGRVNFKDDRGEYGGFVPYYFHRDHGVAHPAHNVVLYDRLERDCVRALESRSPLQSPSGGQRSPVVR